MKQKINDLILLIKQDRKAQVFAGVLALMVIFMLFVDPKKNRPQKTRPENQKQMTVNSGAMGSQEAYQDIITRFSSDMDEIKTQTQQNAEEGKEIRKNMQEYEQRTAEIFKKVLERISENDSAPAMPGQMPGTSAAPIDLSDEAAAEIQTDELDSFGLEEAVVAPPTAPEPGKLAFIGAGDSVRVKLLAGVNAPTDGTPYPVVFKLISDVHGPDGSALPLGEARLIAAAQGSLTDSRALFRLTSLNLQLPSRQRKVIEVDGWIVGEDGIRGMHGVLIDPIGKAIGGAGMAGALQGLGQGFAQAQLDTNQDRYGDTTQVVSGNVGTFAMGKGLSGAAEQWSSIIKERLNQLVPQVEVLSGREATAVFAKSVTIPGLLEALDEDDGAFSSLD